MEITLESVLQCVGRNYLNNKKEDIKTNKLHGVALPSTHALTHPINHIIQQTKTKRLDPLSN
jgi:hypothetical protein